jgi:hypothetical protein
MRVPLAFVCRDAPGRNRTSLQTGLVLRGGRHGGRHRASALRGCIPHYALAVMEGSRSLPVSRNQVDKAGSRVRRAAREGVDVAEEVLEVINEFRAWHFPTLQNVQHELTTLFHGQIGLEEEHVPITSRLKTPPAIVAKLRRSQTSLLRMQDIAGGSRCRVCHRAATADWRRRNRHDENERRRLAYRAAHPLVERRCVVCGRPFTKRPDALVCSARCRNRRKRSDA